MTLFQFCTIFFFCFLPASLGNSEDVSWFAEINQDRPDRIRKNLDLDDIPGMYHLNDSFIPQHYDLELELPFKTENDFDRMLEEDQPADLPSMRGKVRISGISMVSTSKIVMHSYTLEVVKNSVKVVLANGVNIDVKNVQREYENFLVIDLQNEVGVGEKLDIYMEFIQPVYDCSYSWVWALCSKKYQTKEGKTREYVTAYPNHNRGYFPSFNEPHLKATFDVSIIRREGTNSLFNTELISSTSHPDKQGWIVDKFTTTEIIAPSTLGIFLSEFSHVEASIKKLTRVYAPSHLLATGEADYIGTAVKVAEILYTYDEYYGDSSRVPKMDLVIVPNRGVGWTSRGISVYEDITSFRVLDYPYNGKSKEFNSYRETNRLTYLLARQWIGSDYDMYLNYGLRRHTQLIGLQAVSSDSMGLKSAIIRDHQSILLHDGDSTAEPLNETTQYTLADITPSKGTPILRMVEGLVSPKTFQKGLQSYLKKTSRLVRGSHEDLFQSLEEAVNNGEESILPEGLTMTAFMHNWCDQSGYPVVRVKAGIGNSVVLFQERFHMHGHSAREGLWYIPVTVLNQDDSSSKIIWLNNDGKDKQILRESSSKYVVVNVNAIGYFRTLYDTPLLQLLQENMQALNSMTRSQILDDYFVFANENYVSFQEALKLTRYLAQENHLAVWRTFAPRYLDILRKFSAHEGYPTLLGYLQPKVDSAFGAVNSSKMSVSSTILANELLQLSCNIYSKVCAEHAKKLLSEWQASSVTDFAPAKDFECAVVSFGGKTGFDFVLGKYLTAREEFDHSNSRRLLKALSCATDVEIVREFLRKTFNESSGINDYDALEALQHIGASRQGQFEMVNFLTDNIDAIIDVIGGGYSAPIANVLGTLSSYYSTQVQLDEVMRFVATNKDKFNAVVSRDIQGSLERMRENIIWMDSTGKDILAGV